MDVLQFSAVVGLGSFGAGLLGSLTGLGGGVVLVPMLTLVFGVDLRYAIGSSLVCFSSNSSRRRRFFMPAVPMTSIVVFG